MQHDASSFAPEEFEPCPPMFVETADGFALTDAAQELLALMDPPAPEPPTIAERLATLRDDLLALAADLPDAARLMEAHDLLDAVEAVQVASNLLGSCDQAVVAELDRQHVHEPMGATSTADLLRWKLRVRPAEAKRRVTRAQQCAPRVSLDGQVLPPVRDAVAAAQADGSISVDHATVIAHAITRLPVGLPVEELATVEQALVDLARKSDPTDVALAGRKTRDLYDPDGPEPRDQQQRRTRSVTLGQDDDGTGILRGELTADLLVKLQTVLSPLAAPRPADANGDDTRTPGQRMHDALEDLCDRFLRSGTLPDSGGVPATVAVTMTLAQLQERTGRVTTAFGGDLSIGQLLHAACEAEIIPVVLNDAGGIMAYGRSQRFATAGQTKALRARDRGCTFPGCRRPPQWCQRHHVKEWLRDDGDTDLDNLVLLCAYHHHSFEHWGWQVQMRDGMPWWTPPATIDPEQKPVQNTAHLVV